MPSIKEEADQPLANGVSEIETSTGPGKVFIDCQSHRYVLLTINVGAMCDMLRTESQPR